MYVLVNNKEKLLTEILSLD